MLNRDRVFYGVRQQRHTMRIHSSWQGEDEGEDEDGGKGIRSGVP